MGGQVKMVEQFLRECILLTFPLASSLIKLKVANAELLQQPERWHWAEVFFLVCKLSLNSEDEGLLVAPWLRICHAILRTQVWSLVMEVLIRSHMLLKKSYDQPRQHIKKQRHYFANKDMSSQSYGFSSSHVWIWELNYKESWALKNWWFWTVVLEKTHESSLDCKEIQPVHPKGNHPWIFIGRTDAEAETPILWPPDAKNWLIGKDPDAGKDWSWEKGDDRGRDGWMASLTRWTWV